MSSSKATSKGPNRAREVAAERLAAQRGAERRRKAVLASILTIAVLAAAGIIGAAFYYTQQKSQLKNFAIPAGASATGYVVGNANAKVTVDVYLDFLCPICKKFEDQSGPTLQKELQSGTAKIVYHPVSILNFNSSPAGYSGRAAAASGCAIDAKVFPAFMTALYAQQPAEGSAGLSNDQLVEIGKKAGATSPDFGSCVTSQKYSGWSANITDAASRKGFNSTPTVLINGTQLDNPGPQFLAAAIQKAAQ